jgi:hypothetical protein
MPLTNSDSDSEDDDHLMNENLAHDDIFNVNQQLAQQSNEVLQIE